MIILKKKKLSNNIYEYIQNCIDNGAGEIMINLVHYEGSLKGIDINFLKKFNNQFKTPCNSSWRHK